MSHDEYTDYSCSTSIERLARDVETLMRSWHLVGSDRHVSFSHSSSYSSSGNMPTLERSKSSSTLLGAKKRQTINSREGDSKRVLKRRHSSIIQGRPEQKQEDSSPDEQIAVRLIRSSEVVLTMSLAQRGKASVSLTLSLWDGPKRDVSKGDEDEDLPHSLRRLPFTEFPLGDAFDNFSFVFGIGQHITLTPTKVEDSITEAIHVSIAKRHAPSTSPRATTSALSTILQTALNCAVSNCQCRIPVFGLWGQYQPQKEKSVHTKQQTFLPDWITESPVPTLYRKKKLFKKKRKKQSQQYLNRQACTSPLAACCMPGSHVDAPGATFWASVVPRRGSGSLNEWARILLQHLPGNEKSIVLWGARHTFAWCKPRRKERTSILFDNGDHETYRQWRPPVLEMESTDDINIYRTQCRQHAQSLLEEAVGATPDEPMWGSADDPLESVTVKVTWNGRKTVTWNGRKTEDSVEPLLLLPLRIRSRNMSGSDLHDMEHSMERTTLDPFHLSANFVVQIQYDNDTSLTSLAASQRCVLAALIRTAALHPDTLLQHVTNEVVLDEWGEGKMDMPALEWILNHSRVGPVTKKMVDAMGWMDVADHMIEYEQAQQIVQHVLDQTSTLTFPSPPEGAFATNNEEDDELFAPLHKSAPYGRLVSILFAHMARLRSPSSMGLVWLAFVTELRNRWYARESLPNMAMIPGMDPHPSHVNRVFSTIGVKADQAAFVHCSEPDPDDNNCLIGQKLQVFNICVESTTALELLEMERMERLHVEQQQHDDSHSKDLSDVDDESDHACEAPSVASTEVMNNATPLMNSALMSDTASADADDSRESSLSRRSDTDLLGFGIDGKRGPIVDATPPKGFMGVIAEGHESSTASTSSKLGYCDATEGRSLMGSENFDCGFESAAICHGRDDTANVTQRQNRQGARCPVHGLSLVASGDQLYAPYLQRPNPLTDKAILERRLMLAQRRQSGTPSKRSADGKRRVQDRVELAQRLQKPKLLSDMRAFKAANPGAVFQDFTNWYGNPGNPLDEYKDVDDEDSYSMDDIVNMSTAMKLDRASEAIQILNATRDFWSDTWDEAAPCAAVEQEPLFDVFKTVEMLLHHLETLHPANLVNQVMAVNLSMSYFVLVTSARDALQVGMVKKSLQKLRENIEAVLELLSRDATDGAYAFVNDQHDFGRLPKHASSVAIQSCEEVCDEMAETEALLTRATTLLHKFPRQYDLVQTMLRRADGDSISVDSEEGRRGILSAIQSQQDNPSDAANDLGLNLPVPCLREYLLRNRDDASPCQLCVRLGNEEVVSMTNSGGGILLALTKCQRD